MPKKIAYSGIEGAFAYIAARKIFPNEILVPHRDFQSAYHSVENDECDFAVLPIENSFAGEVGQVTDLMFQGNLYVNGLFALDVVQNLLGVKGSTLESVKKVISHPQALEQCSPFLERQGYETLEEVNTARAAKKISDLNDKTLAAIASEETAKLYNLEILAKNINEQTDNSTRFAILSKNNKNLFEQRQNKEIIMFTVKNESGSLVKVLNKLGDFGFNMTEIRSRPLKGLAWTYYFYIEAEGNYDTPDWNQMILEMSYRCDKLKVLGKF